MNVDSTVLQNAYNWALQHGYDPKRNDSGVGGEQPMDLSVGTVDSSAGAPGEYGQMFQSQAFSPTTSLSSSEIGGPGRRGDISAIGSLSSPLPSGDVSVRVTPQSPPPPAPATPLGPTTLSIGSPTTPGGPIPTAVTPLPVPPLTTAPGVLGQQQLSTQLQQQQQQLPHTQATIFESMIAGTVPCKAIYSDELCGVIVDANPQAPLHLLIFPKRRADMQRLSTITDERHALLLGHMLVVARLLIEHYGYKERGCRLVINDGEDSGQSIPHIAVHLLAGRMFTWPPG